MNAGMNCSNVSKSIKRFMDIATYQVVGHLTESSLRGYLQLVMAVQHRNSAKKLDDIGFVWSRWDEMFTRLECYKRSHGDCQVPISYPDDPKLGIWVSSQRRAFACNKLREDRKQKLNSIGFTWNMLNKRSSDTRKSRGV